MRFGGLQKTSLIDFPGKISCVLFLSGCNFHCPYCHNPELVHGRPGSTNNGVDLKQILNFLGNRKGLLDGVVISGGEPTLAPGIFQLCRTIGNMGFKVKLDTNGSRPDILKGLIDDGLVDFIAMDIKTSPDRYAPTLCLPEEAAGLTESIALIMASGLPHEFRTTCVRPVVDADAIRQIAKLIKGASRYALQQFQPAKVLNPDYFAGLDCQIEADELDTFRAIAESAVDTCIIR